MVGKRIGGINGFGGGLALYDADGTLVAGLVGGWPPPPPPPRGPVVARTAVGAPRERGWWGPSPFGPPRIRCVSPFPVFPGACFSASCPFACPAAAGTMVVLPSGAVKVVLPAP